MVEAGSLKKGDCVEIEGEPFRVEGVQSVVTSRHSHAKMKMEAHGMFSGSKKVLSIPHDATFDKVDLIRKHGQLIAKTSDTTCQVMDLRDYSIRDASISQDLMQRLSEGDEVTYIEYGGKTRVLESRV